MVDVDVDDDGISVDVNDGVGVVLESLVEFVVCGGIVVSLIFVVVIG